MSYKKLSSLFFLIFFWITGAWAQQVSGTVTDEKGQVLPGGNIIIKGTTSGTTANAEGKYQLPVESLSDTLVFSFVGYKKQEVPINGRTQIDVSMQRQRIQGDEVVVVGYGTVEEENLTSSVSKVSSDEFVQGSATDAAQLIRGKVPGLTVNKVGSNPAEDSELKLRGIGTLEGDASPLVIIDGVEGSLSDVAPQDIASVNVIKDASASAIYGTRGSNGVVVIQTKGAGKDGLNLEVNSYATTQQITEDVPVLSASAYRDLVEQDTPGATDYGGSTNWANQVLRDNPISQVHNITLSSGNDQTSYVANLNYQRQKGLMKRSNNNTLKGRFRIDHSMFDGKLDVTGNILVSKEWRYDGTENLNNSFSGRILRDVFAFNPTRPIKNEDGSYNENADNNSDNPVSILQETNGDYKEDRAKLFGDVEYSPIENLTLKAQGSHLTTSGLQGYSETKQNVLNIQSGLNGYASRTTSKTTETILNLTAEYKSSFQDHDYSLLGGYTWKEHVYEDFFASNYNFPIDQIRYNNLSDGKALTEGQAFMDSYKWKSNLVGYFARLNYDYQNKYLLMASFRREASSKFGKNNKWGLFPAFSVGWNISQEAFMSSLDAIDNLKVRFGFGVTGSEPTNPYESLSRLSFGNKYRYNGQWVSTIQPLNNPNPNLQWEEKTEYNLGVDFAVLDNRIDGSVDLYRRETSNLLFPFTVPTPPYLYDTILANAGTIRNEGVEVLVNTTPVQSNELQWNSTINYSTNRNKLVSLSSENYSLGRGFFDVGSTGSPISQITHRVEVGKSIGNFYGYKSVGVTDDGFWEIEGQDGQAKPITQQDPGDRQIIGNGVPDFQLSWSNSVNYRNWDLSVTMRGAFGFQILNLRRMYYNVPTQIKGGNVMKGTFDDVYGERPLSVDQSKQYVSYFVEDGDFWKIDNITLGYNFSVESLRMLNKARLYASVDNFYTFTGYSGFDPEVNFAGLTPGFDNRDRFPTSRQFTLGVQLTF